MLLETLMKGVSHNMGSFKVYGASSHKNPQNLKFFLRKENNVSNLCKDFSCYIYLSIISTALKNGLAYCDLVS